MGLCVGVLVCWSVCLWVCVLVCLFMGLCVGVFVYGFVGLCVSVLNSIHSLSPPGTALRNSACLLVK